MSTPRDRKSKMSLDHAASKPHEALAVLLRDDMEAVNTLIEERMASKHAPRIPEVTAHLVGAGGKRLRPMLTLAAARYQLPAVAAARGVSPDRLQRLLEAHLQAPLVGPAVVNVLAVNLAMAENRWPDQDE